MDFIVNLTGEKDGYIVDTDGNDWYLGSKQEAARWPEIDAKWIADRNGGTYEKVCH